MHTASFAIISTLLVFPLLQAADHKNFGPHSFEVIGAVVMKSIEELELQ
jgi:hypothetical protein